ncbi:hypothetical protein I6Y99_004397 [Vibrio parahaemolyticus]|nr:hypothetical protein [Vibrio parahaemolyticus]
MFPKFFYQTGIESDRMYIAHRIDRFPKEKRTDISVEYDRLYKKWGRVHANAWLSEITERFGNPVPDNILLIQQRLERLNQMSREKRSA